MKAYRLSTSSRLRPKRYSSPGQPDLAIQLRAVGSRLVAVAANCASDDQRERIGTGLQLGRAGFKIQQLHDRKHQHRLAAPEGMTIVLRAPVAPLIGQDHQGRDRTIVTVHQARVIGVEPPRKPRIRLALHLGVDQHPGLLAAEAPDLDQLVDIPPTDHGAARDLLQLLVEKLEATRPVDVGRDRREEELQKRPLPTVEQILPGGIIIVAIGGGLAHGPLLSVFVSSRILPDRTR
ncbi:hypothetical protein [Thiocapsa sp.]|uniref:hypothetical protein n=1 Tax=Thiocapsa sp. TaxID=2024551 RepID=UPI001BCCBF3A|nr:hypothetical protein [Thiocapsa sp.]